MTVELDQAVKKLFGDEVVGGQGRVEDLVEGVISLDPEGPVVPRRGFGAFLTGRGRSAGRVHGGEQGDERQEAEALAARGQHGVAIMISKTQKKIAPLGARSIQSKLHAKKGRQGLGEGPSPWEIAINNVNFLYAFAGGLGLISPPGRDLLEDAEEITTPDFSILRSV